MVAYVGLEIQHKNGNDFLQGTKVNKFPAKNVKLPLDATKL